MSELSNEERWRSGGEGRLDADGLRWWACDPYPTWYRYDGLILRTRGDQNGATWVDYDESIDVEEDNSTWGDHD